MSISFVWAAGANRLDRSTCTPSTSVSLSARILRTAALIASSLPVGGVVLIETGGDASVVVIAVWVVVVFCRLGHEFRGAFTGRTAIPRRPPRLERAGEAGRRAFAFVPPAGAEQIMYLVPRPPAGALLVAEAVCRAAAPHEVAACRRARRPSVRRSRRPGRRHRPSGHRPRRAARRPGRTDPQSSRARRPIATVAPLCSGQVQLGGSLRRSGGCGSPSPLGASFVAAQRLSSRTLSGPVRGLRIRVSMLRMTASTSD